MTTSSNKELSRKVIQMLLDKPEPPTVALVRNATIRRFTGTSANPKLAKAETLEFGSPLAVYELSDSVWLVCKI